MSLPGQLVWGAAAPSCAQTGRAESVNDNSGALCVPKDRTYGQDPRPHSTGAEQGLNGAPYENDSASEDRQEDDGWGDGEALELEEAQRDAAEERADEGGYQ